MVCDFFIFYQEIIGCTNRAKWSNALISITINKVNFCSIIDGIHDRKIFQVEENIHKFEALRTLVREISGAPMSNT